MDGQEAITAEKAKVTPIAVGKAKPTRAPGGGGRRGDNFTQKITRAQYKRLNKQGQGNKQGQEKCSKQGQQKGNRGDQQQQ